MRAIRPPWILVVAMALTAAESHARDGPDLRSVASVSPDRPRLVASIEADSAAPARGKPRRRARFPREFRTLNGRANNGKHPEWGAAGQTFLRLVPAAYGDGRSEPSGRLRPNVRTISNLCAAADEALPNAHRASAYLWLWGQFVDHDFALTPVAEPAERLDIEVPRGDPWFDPHGTGAATIPFERSAYRMRDGERQQVNAITAFLDASNVYSSDRERAAALRTLDGTGRLKTSAGDLLPYNTDRLPNAPSPDPRFFLAGDFRANEHVGLLAIHTLFVREHNYWAGVFRDADAGLDGETIYQYARAIVGAEIQAITYREFLPVLFGKNALARHRRYRRRVDPGLSNVFATGAYRFGHSMLPSELLRLDAAGDETDGGHLSLAAAFFRPAEIERHGIDSLLRGFATQMAHEIDNVVVDEVRNFLFGEPGKGGLDLAALNIQRGRDHGLPSYNVVRAAFDLAPVATFADINPDPAVQADLRAAYGTVDDLDLWVAGLAESHLPGAMMGETFRTILIEQFERLRSGDRFWYQSYLPEDLVDLVERQTLSRIIRRNTGIGAELPARVFRVHR